MALTLTYHFENEDALRAHLDRVAGGQTVNVVSTPEPEVPAEPDPEPEKEAEPDPAEKPAAKAKKPARKSTKKKEPEAKQDDEVTADDARDALRRLHEAKGMDAARAALQHHGAERLRELEPEDFAPFIKFCEDQTGLDD